MPHKSVSPNHVKKRYEFVCTYVRKRGFSMPYLLFFRNDENASSPGDGNHNLTCQPPSNQEQESCKMTSEDLLQPGHVVKERWKVCF